MSGACRVQDADYKPREQQGRKGGGGGGGGVTAACQYKLQMEGFGCTVFQSGDHGETGPP